MLSALGLAVLALMLRPVSPGPRPPANTVATAVTTLPTPQTPEELYIDLLKKTLTRAQVAGRIERHPLRPPDGLRRWALRFSCPVLSSPEYELVALKPTDPEAYMEAGYANQARDESGETMVGLKQLDNIQYCVTDVLRRKVPGDLIEAGAWRGGVTILMRGILKAYGDHERNVWVADSFEGLPPLDRAKNADWSEGQMAVSIEEAKENFAGYGLLDNQVRFLKGFFSNTLPKAPIDKLAVFRADADLYESTLDALNTLYPKLSVGGYAVFDDYQNLSGCRRAIDEYRAAHGITEPIQPIDKQAVYWRRER